MYIHVYTGCKNLCITDITRFSLLEIYSQNTMFCQNSKTVFAVGRVHLNVAMFAKKLCVFNHGCITLQVMKNCSVFPVKV